MVRIEDFKGAGGVGSGVGRGLVGGAGVAGRVTNGDGDGETFARLVSRIPTPGGGPEGRTGTPGGDGGCGGRVSPGVIVG